MNRKMYNKALSYAFMLMPYHQHYYDLVHDAYVAYHKSTGLDLFEQPERTMIATIKNVWLNFISKNRYQVDGEKRHRVFEPIEGDVFRGSIVSQDDKVAADDSAEWLYNEAKNYYGTLAVKDRNHRLTYKSALDATEEIVNLKYQGYSQKEISEKIDTSTTSIKKYMDVLKKIIVENDETPFESVTFNNYNPFNGSRVVVEKSILSTTYAKQKEKYSEYEYNTDNGADYNEFYILLTHKTKGINGGLLIKNTDKVKLEPE